MHTIIKKETMQFLEELKRNNKREWFTQHKNRYLAAHENFLTFLQELIDEMKQFDPSLENLTAKECAFRIYRDVRFSKDKSPYKTTFGAILMKGGKSHGVMGYGIRIGSDDSYLVCGVSFNDAKKLHALREHISKNGEEFLSIINDKTFKKNFVLTGEKLKNVPQGFDKEDPMAEYLKYTRMVARHEIDEKHILSADFGDYCLQLFKQLLPLYTFLKAYQNTK